MYPVQNYQGTMNIHNSLAPKRSTSNIVYLFVSAAAQMSTSPSSGIQTTNQSPQVIGMQASGMLAPQGGPTPSYALQPAAGYHAQ